MTDRRFIEESFPVKEVSAISAKEKNIRHGHISTLHIWWARRPLAASRATAYAALVPPAQDELGWQTRHDFIIELSKWENSLSRPLLDKARRDILEAHAQRLSAERGELVTVEDIQSGRAPHPRVLDPFAGGGAIPLEALRLGCETYASDYNPVAVLLLKATLEYPQLYGRAVTQESATDMFGQSVLEARTVNPLLEAVKKWAEWVREEARNELAAYYPPDPDGSIPVGYFWARTISCQNPACRAEIPVMGQFWLAKTNQEKRVGGQTRSIPTKRIGLRPVVRSGAVVFEVSNLPLDWHCKGRDCDCEMCRGTATDAVVTCPVCGGMIDAKTVRQLFRGGKAGQRMVAVVLHHPLRQGKTYRLATDADVRRFAAAETDLQGKMERLALRWGLDSVPDEPIPLMSGTFNVPIYGINKWGSLFNSRQQMALITFADKVRLAHEEMTRVGMSSSMAVAVSTYLALCLDRLADRGSNVCRWDNTRESIVNTYARQALPMLWDYVESNPFSGATGDWSTAIDWICRVIEHTSSIPPVSNLIPSISQCSATQLPYDEATFDAVFTDPPYYNSVPYADLSDFFYVWLKRSLGDLHPDLFSTPLAPKDKEIAEMAGWDPERYAYKNKSFFEHNLGRALQEVRRVLRPGGIAVVVYAHKSTEGWETVINALLDCGLVITAAWPVHTEMGERLRARESATLASSIYIVARKMTRQPTGLYNPVRDQLQNHLDAKLNRLWEEGTSGADFFIAAIGSAIEVFGKYEQVIDFEGNVVRADRLLEDVRTIATDYAVRQILRDGFSGEVSDLTRLYVLWRWEYGEAQVPFDEAQKLARSCGLDLAREWGRGGFVRKEKEFIRVVGPQRRDLDALEDSRELIDVLHRVLLLWEKGRRAEIVQALASTGFGQSEAFYRVAQAVSETLPNESKEKKLLDGFLAGRARVREEVDKAARQDRLFE